MIDWLFTKAPPMLVAFMFIVVMALLPLLIVLVLCESGDFCP